LLTLLHTLQSHSLPDLTFISFIWLGPSLPLLLYNLSPLLYIFCICMYMSPFAIHDNVDCRCWLVFRHFIIFKHYKTIISSHISNLLLLPFTLLYSTLKTPSNHSFSFITLFHKQWCIVHLKGNTWWDTVHVVCFMDKTTHSQCYSLHLMMNLKPIALLLILHLLLLLIVLFHLEHHPLVSLKMKRKEADIMNVVLSKISVGIC